jgi:hypothetical protein
MRPTRYARPVLDTNANSSVQTVDRTVRSFVQDEGGVVRIGRRGNGEQDDGDHTRWRWLRWAVILLAVGIGAALAAIVPGGSHRPASNVYDSPADIAWMNTACSGIYASYVSINQPIPDPTDPTAVSTYVTRVETSYPARSERACHARSVTHPEWRRPRVEAVTNPAEQPL